MPSGRVSGGWSRTQIRRDGGNPQVPVLDFLDRPLSVSVRPAVLAAWSFAFWMAHSPTALSKVSGGRVARMLWNVVIAGVV